MKNYKRYRILSLLALATIGKISAQEGFGTATPNKATIIDAQSSTKGAMVPRVALTSLTSFSPLDGGTGYDTQTANAMLVFNTATVGTTLTPGYYFWSQTNAINGTWNRLLVSTGAGTVTLAGNVTGSIDANTVSSFKNDTSGMPISLSGPANAQVIRWNGTSWVASTLGSATLTGRNLTSNDLTITNPDALLQPIDLAIKPKAVVPAKLNSGASSNGQIYTANGSGGVTLADIAGKGYAGTFNTTYNLIGGGSIIPGNPSYATQNTNRSYTGASISLPPGKFMVYMGSAVFARNAANTANSAPNSTGPGLYVYYYLGDSEDPGTSTDNSTAYSFAGYTGKRAGAAIIAGGAYKAFVSGSIIINNTDNTQPTRTFYIHSGVRRSSTVAGDAVITVAGSFYSGTVAPLANERYLFAIPIQ